MTTPPVFACVSVVLGTIDTKLEAIQQQDEIRVGQWGWPGLNLMAFVAATQVYTLSSGVHMCDWCNHKFHEHVW
jgi:hypothetical protein